jgi:hypothetical protein
VSGSVEPRPGDLPPGLRRVCVGVVPPAAAAVRPRLLAALEAAYPVRFVARAAGDWHGLDAVLALPGAQRAEEPAVPVLRTLADEPVTALGTPSNDEAAVDLARHVRLARPLRGVRLHDPRAAAAAGLPAVPASAGDVLAAAGDGTPRWRRRDTPVGARHVAALAPAELAEGEALRERLIPGRSVALLPVVQFLSDLTAGRRWRAPVPRAAFVLDDPNLHWPSYGHVKYDRLLAHARQHGHHVAIATVPLDAWLVHRRAARVFREGRDGLSLCVHGNDHTGPELWHLRTDDGAVAAAAQALRRVIALERRAGVLVSRVMVPPHEKVSEPAARALMALGYEAVCNTRPYPWAREVETAGPHWLARPPEAGPLTGWHSVDVVGDGLPVLLRAGFEHPREDLALRAFLGQPLILYGHHDDLRGGLDVLAKAAADVNALGDVTWAPLHRLARAGVETLHDGTTLHVRPLARRIALDIPPGIQALALDTTAFARELSAVVEIDGRFGRPADEPLHVTGPGRMELTLRPAKPGTAPGSGPPRRLWPLARRIAVEGRDRAHGLLVRD